MAVMRLASPDEKIYCVYALIDPRTDKYFYIGEGLLDRPYVHWEDFKSKKYKRIGKNNYKLMVLRELVNLQLEPIIKIIAQNLSKSVALKIETKLIARYGRLCDGSGILTNILTDSSKNPMIEQEVKIKSGKSISKFYSSEKGQEVRARQSVTMKDRITKLFSGEEGDAFKKRLFNIVSKTMVDLRWINDGNEEQRIHKDLPLPVGWRFGKLKRICITNEIEEKRILLTDQIPKGWREGFKCGRKWINNGEIETHLQPGQKMPNGFKRGRIPWKNKK